MLRDALPLVLAADHEPRDVLKEEKRQFALRTQLDEVNRLQRGLGKQDSVIRHDSERHVEQGGEARDHGGSVVLLELHEPTAVHNARDHLADVERLLGVFGNDARNLAAVVQRLLHRRREGVCRLELAVEVGVLDDVSTHFARLHLVLRHVIRHATHATVHVRAAQRLCGDHLARSRLHQRRTAQEDGAVAFHDDGLVGHAGNVRTSGGAAAEHLGVRRGGGRDDGNLGDPLGGHDGLVVEDASEMISIGEDVGLERQVCATRIHCE